MSTRVLLLMSNGLKKLAWKNDVTGVNTAHAGIGRVLCDRELLQIRRIKKR